MAIAALLEFPPQPGLSEAESREQYDDVSREFTGGQLMRSCADWGPGHQAHVAGQAEDGSWWVVDVWESQEAMDRFLGRMMPILQPRIDEAGMSEPAVRVLAVHNLVTD
jgi:hypothetical protein